MSAEIPVIADWIRQGLRWHNIYAPVIRPITLQPNEMLQIPSRGRTFNFPEGVLIWFSAGFDSPKCGARLESYPSLDTGTLITIENMVAGGMDIPEVIIYTRVPPNSSLYYLRVVGKWVFEKWLRLYIFNTDSVPHTCLGYAYHLAVLDEERK